MGWEGLTNMFDDSRAFVTRAFLRAELGLEYKAWAESADDAILLARLKAWAKRLKLKETSAEGAFIQTFFVDTWNHGDAGRTERDQVTWSDAALAVPYTALPEGGEWLMATGEDRALIDRLARTCLRLDDARLTTHIFQGLITSADSTPTNMFAAPHSDSAPLIPIVR